MGRSVFALIWMGSYGNTAKTRIIEPCAMSLRIPYSRIGAKDTAKNQLLSPSGGHKKTKKYQTLPEEATPTT